MKMRTALSSWPCFSCLKRSRQVEEATGAENNGEIKAVGRPSERSDTQDSPMMYEAGEVTVLPPTPSPSPQARPTHEHRPLTRLYCNNGGYHLRLTPEGRVSGGRQDNDPYDVLRLRAVSVGVVVIKGEHSGLYLAMDTEGRLYGARMLNDECHFIEKLEENHYNTYRSKMFGWYVGLKKNGEPKPGRDTHLGQKAVLFLPRPV